MYKKFEITFDNGTLEIRSYNSILDAIRYYGDFGEEHIIKIEQIER